MATEESEEQPIELTTEEIVRQQTITNNRPLIQLHISQAASELNKKRTFVDRDSHLGTEGLVEYRSFKDPNFELTRQILEVGVQSSAQYVDQPTQSSWSRLVNSSAQTEYAQLHEKHKDSIQAQDDFIEFIRKVQERISPILEANLASDVFRDQLSMLVASDDSLVKSFSVSQLKECYSLKDARFNSPICSIDWQSHDTVGISFASTTTFDQYLKTWPEAPVEHLFLWNFTSILHPTFVLESPSVVKAFEFCPTNPNIIAGGCENGQVLLWDLSDPQTKVHAELRNRYSTEDSFSEAFHPKYSSVLLTSANGSTKAATQPITDLHWVPKGNQINRMGDILSQDENAPICQFVTVSLDGKMIVWDVNIDPTQVHPNVDGFLPGASLANEWQPAFTMNILRAPKSPVFLPCRLFHLVTKDGKLTGDCRIATEEGQLLGFNWHADRSMGARQNPPVTIQKQLLYHTALALEASPFLNGLYLLCDRSQIVLAFLKDSTIELFRSAARSQAITCAQFSPTRPSLFVVGKENGEIEVWAVLDKSHECLFTQSVASSKVVSLKFGEGHNGKQFLAVGCGDGSLMIYKVPAFMSKPGPNELEQMNAFIEQQKGFVAQTEERFKLRQPTKQQLDAENAKKDKHEGENESKEEEDTDEDKVDVELLQFEREYARIIKDFQAMEEKAD